VTTRGAWIELRQNTLTDSSKSIFRQIDSETRIETGADGSASATPIVFMPGGSEAMRITTDGYVGIGTTSPAQKLHVEGQCVTGDTKLAIFEQGSQFAVRSLQIKEIKIKDIKPGSYVYSLNEKTGKVEPAKVKALLDMGVKPVFRLTTESGKTIKTTGNHPYLAIRQQYEDKKQKTTIQLRTAESVAREHGLDPESLSKDREIPQGGAIWVDFTNEEGGSFSASEYSRGSRQIHQPGVQSISFERQRKSFRNSNLSILSSQTQLSQTRSNSEFNQSSSQYSSSTGIFKKISQEAKWTKVIYLKEGDLIAIVNFPEPRTSNSEPYVLWEKISSIEYVGYETRIFLATSELGQVVQQVNLKFLEKQEMIYLSVSIYQMLVQIGICKYLLMLLAER